MREDRRRLCGVMAMIGVSVGRFGGETIARSTPDDIGSRIDGKPHDER